MESREGYYYVFPQRAVKPGITVTFLETRFQIKVCF